MCFSARLLLASGRAEAVYECIAKLASRLCMEGGCARPEPAAWLIYGSSECLVEVATPAPRLPQLAGAPMSPAAAAVVKISCSSPSGVVDAVNRVLDVVRECKGVGAVLEE